VKSFQQLFASALGLLLGVNVTFGQTAFQFTNFTLLTNREAFLQIAAPTGLHYRVDVSSNLQSWNGFLTFLAGSTALRYTDSAAPFLSSRLYRAWQLTNSSVAVGEHLPTTNGDVIIRSIYHASTALTWNNRTVYFDPSTNRFNGLPLADLILYTHPHGDHFNGNAIAAIRATNGIIVAPQAVYDALPSSQKSSALVLTNGAATNLFGIGIEAIAMYNTNSSPLHPKGWGNGYVLTFADKRIYFTGDTDNTPEMRALTNIDVAFICMRGPPPNMDIPDAIRAVSAFRPSVIYPYHYTTNTTAKFKQQLGTNLAIEVRLRNWYPTQQ
jgi:L-ascorbate metabolism protein UlaG (beta-lactamase superfamily)